MERQGALKGVRVADLTFAATGPVTTSYLGDHGATVIKVESHTKFDNTRAVRPLKDGISDLNHSGFFTHQNSSKYSITLNLTLPQGREIALRLAKWADVWVESLTPGVVKRLGLDYDSVKKAKPDIIYLSISMQGQYGPNSGHSGYGQVAGALSGLIDLCGWPDRGPAPPHAAYIDTITPIFSAVAILAALDHRRRTGEGQYLDASLSETALQFVSPVFMDYVANGRIAQRNGNRLSYAAPHGVFRCRGDDRWCAVAIFGDEEWQRFCQVLGKPCLTDDPRYATFVARKQNEDELERLVEAWTVSYSPEEVVSMMQAAGLAASAVESTKDLFQDPQLLARGHFLQLEHAVMGPIVHGAAPFRLSKTPAHEFAGPALGQHNEYVYKEILGMSEDELSDLIAEGVVTTEA